MTDFLDEKRREITDRLAELKPLVDEYNQLQTAASALAGVGGSGKARAKATGRRRGPGRPRGSVSKAATKAPAKSGQKSDCQKSRSPAGQTRSRRPSQRQRHTRRRSTHAGAGTARDHDSRAGGEDGHQAELPLPCAPRVEVRRQGRQARPWLDAQKLAARSSLRQGAADGRARNNTPSQAAIPWSRPDIDLIEGAAGRRALRSGSDL